MPPNDTPPEIGMQHSKRPPRGGDITFRRAGKYTEDPVSLGLRKLWQNVEKEPVPMEFLDLLDAIDAARDGDGEAPADARAAKA